MVKESIEAAVKKALAELGAPDISFVVSRPASMAHGDFATNAALPAGKLLGRNPREMAEALQEKLSIEGVERVEVAGAGFINFFLSPESIGKEVVAAATSDTYGTNTLYEDKKVMVEYTDPNPFKEFHIGHLMSNAIGESIARLLERSGAMVMRANYQGDVGPHVAKALHVLLEKNIENPTIKDISAAYVEGARRYEEVPEEKAAIDLLNKRIYEKTDERVNALYEKGRTLTLEHFEVLYKTLGTKFDRYYFESETAPIGVTTVHAHPDVFIESEGATVFKGESYGLHTRVFLNKMGLPTYEAKDLGLVVEKQKEKCDEYIYITANEQSDYFKVVFLAAKIVFPNIEGKLLHRSHGMMRFSSGKMSSRLGNVVTGESLIVSLKDAAQEKMAERSLENAEQVATDVAVGAIKYTVLKQSTGKDIIFDPEKSLSLEGDSGPYLQYAHTRARSLIREAKKAGITAHTSGVVSPAKAALARTLIHFPHAVARAAQELEPHHVATYLIELASTFNSWYASERLIGGENPEFALMLTEAVERVLSSGLYILGISAPERM